MKRISSVLTALLFLITVMAGADVLIQLPPDIDGIDTDGDSITDNDHVGLSVAAGDGFVNMGDGRLMYMFGFSDVNGVPADMIMMEGMLNAQLPAPTIKVREGQKLYLTLTNVGMMIRRDLFDPHSIHWHGFPNASAVFDGVPDASIAINMGSSLTYFYNVVEPGTYLWHCHVEATEHMQMGMLGNLYVLPKQDRLPTGTNLNGFVHQARFKYCYNDGDGSTYYDVDYPIQLSGFDPDFHDASFDVQPLPFALMEDRYPMFNGRGYPDTIDTAVIWNTADIELGLPSKPSQKVSSLITAVQGEKILLRISSVVTTRHHSVTVLGIPMTVVGMGSRELKGPTGKKLHYKTSTITLGGGETADVILDTSKVAPGTYFMYTSNLNYLANNDEDFGGMMTEIVIKASSQPTVVIEPNLTNGTMSITGPEVPGQTIAIYWREDLQSGTAWKRIVNPVGDLVHNTDGTWTWVDRGTDPLMGGQKPGDVQQRYYMVLYQ